MSDINPQGSPRRLRIATWNVCWFASLFDDRDRLVADRKSSGVYGVSRRRQAQAIGNVLRRVDADLWAIIEAPNTGKSQSTVRALAGFCDELNLRQNSVLTGFPSETEQEIALLFDPIRISAEHAPVGHYLDEAAAGHANPDPAPRFDGVYPLDLDGDGEIDVHRFSKPPLEAEINVTGVAAPIRMIAVHAKSKAPHGARSLREATRISLLNRRKQLAQCAWLRARLDQHLAAGDNVIALGDFNDGPGQDKYERVFGRSGVEIVTGSVLEPEMRMHTQFLGSPRPSGGRPATARFYSRQTKSFVNALIDFVMLSPKLYASTEPRWRIWHPFDDAECFEDEAFRDDLLEASDHFPVSVDLTFPEAS
ncbi:MAG: endonuclease/exonuclease/phosphatase family protein [Pseudomonadota bacterium]